MPPKKVNDLMFIRVEGRPELRNLLLGLTAFCLILVSGCAVGPDYRPPDTTVPSTWDGQHAVTPAHPSKTTLDPVSLVEWWTAFNDPTLSSLVDMAVRANLDVRLAEARPHAEHVAYREMLG